MGGKEVNSNDFWIFSHSTFFKFIGRVNTRKVKDLGEN